MEESEKVKIDRSTIAIEYCNEESVIIDKRVLIGANMRSSHETNGASRTLNSRENTGIFVFFKAIPRFYDHFLIETFRQVFSIYVPFVTCYFESANDAIIIVLGKNFVFSYIHSTRFLSFQINMKRKGKLKGRYIHSLPKICPYIYLI